jgi:hypothetical protein
MANALNSLGRGTGRKFNMAAVKRELEARQVAKEQKERAREQRQAKERAERLANPINIFGGR